MKVYFPFSFLNPISLIFTFSEISYSQTTAHKSLFSVLRTLYECVLIVSFELKINLFLKLYSITDTSEVLYPRIKPPESQEIYQHHVLGILEVK